MLLGRGGFGRGRGGRGGRGRGGRGRGRNEEKNEWYVHPINIIIILLGYFIDICLTNYLFDIKGPRYQARSSRQGRKDQDY